MSHPNGPKTSTASLTKPCADGLIPKKLNSNARMEDISDFLLGIQRDSAGRSFTVESPPQNKKMISKGKSNLCNKNSQVMKSSPKLEVDSTSNVKNFSHFYNESSMEMFQKLWFPP